MPVQASQDKYSHDLREKLDAPRVGNFRENHKNPLLQKHHLGCVKPTTYDLPSVQNFQHAYGLEQMRDGSSSNETIGNWAAHDGTDQTLPPRDFKELNKQAAVAGCHSTKQVNEFRVHNDARLKVTSDKVPIRKYYDEHTTFGRSTSASENFNDIFSHAYRFDWISENQGRSMSMMEKAKAKKPGQTKTSLLAAQTARAKMAPDTSAPPWKLSNFASVPAKIGQKG